MTFTKSAIVTAVLAAVSTMACAEKLESPITEDKTLEAVGDYSIDGPTVVQGTNKIVTVKTEGFGLTLNNSTTGQNNQGVIYNTTVEGKGTETLTINANFVGLGTGSNTISNLNEVSIHATGKDAKALTGYGKDVIENVKTVSISSDEDAIHMDSDASGSIKITGFDTLSLHGNKGYAIQSVASSADNSLVIKGNENSIANFSTDKKSDVINQSHGDVPDHHSVLSVSAGQINITNNLSTGNGINVSGNGQATFTTKQMIVKTGGIGVQAKKNSNINISANTVKLEGTKDTTRIGLEGKDNSKITIKADELEVSARKEAIKATNKFAGEINIEGLDESTRNTVTLHGNVSVAGGVLNFTNSDIRLDAGKTFDVKNLVGEGSSLIIGGFVDNGATVSITDNNAKDFTIVADGRLNDQYSNAEELLNDLKNNIQIENQVEGEMVGLGAEAGSVADGWLVDETGHLKPTGNPSMAAVSNFNAMNLAQWRGEINHLTQRLGDIRANGSTVGTWARLYGYENEVNDIVTIKMKTRSVQAGGDYRLNNNWVIGGAFSYTDADADFSNGSGKADGYTLAAYATGFFDCGGFVDVVGRVGRLSSDVTADTLSNVGGVLTGSYDNTALGLSVETGYHWKLNDTFYIEPQAELAYGIVLGDDFTSSTNGVKIEQDDFETLVGRLGARFGATFNEGRGQIYAHCSVNHDFMGEANATATPAWGVAQKIGADLGGTWTSFGFGAEFDLRNNLTFYGSLERSNGSDYSEDYRYSVGARYVF